ncbi:MAG: hypothetical protein P8X74_15430 [Reinekea sp.]|jgi:uncharacterized protein involved in propanediol utilization
MNTAQQEQRPQATAERAVVHSQTHIGHGAAPCHHGELLQGIFEESNGKETLGLVTLLHSSAKAKATFIPDPDSLSLTVSPTYKLKALSSVKLTLQELGLPDMGGHLICASCISEELGLGSSTADVVAAARAVCDANQRTLSRETLARIAVCAEVASDPIMFESSTVLFAQREGHIIEEMGPLIPAMSLLSFTLGEPIRTCDYRAPQYSWEDLQQFKPLRGLLRFALANYDLATIARVSTHSALINQKHVPKPKFDAVLSIAEQGGALGVQIAHSGNIVGMMFSPDDHNLLERVSLCQGRLADIGVYQSAFHSTF